MTNFNWLLDGSIVGVYLIATMIAGLVVRKYVGNVEQFLVAGRGTRRALSRNHDDSVTCWRLRLHYSRRNALGAGYRLFAIRGDECGTNPGHDTDLDECRLGETRYYGGNKLWRGRVQSFCES